MSDDLTGLEPRRLWGHFAALARIPRPSGHEERAVEYVRRVAAEHGLPVKTDARGNLVLEVPASPGAERAPRVILQSHLDMVCEKNKGVEHDFMRDPIRPRVEGEWVRAGGTTLGADNGIGVAAALAAGTDPDLVRPPLELLFTLDEETGLTGASQLDGSILVGDTLLNLDSEEDGVLYVGCAGGADTVIGLTPRREAAAPGTAAYALEVTGLRGGHSGMNIVENRGNAIKLLARVLLAADEAGIDYGLVSIEGGGKHNAIPREATAVLRLDGPSRSRLAELIERRVAGFRTELDGVDDGLRASLEPAGDAPGDVLVREDRERLVRLLGALPHGVLAMSRDIAGLVETSSNLAAVAPGDDGGYRIATSSRSSVGPSLDAVQASIRAIAALAGGSPKSRNGYPGWKPNLGSPVLGVMRDVYTEVWDRPPRVTAIHAGLECGLLGEKKPGLDMVSFGPTIEGAHSPDERVHVPAVERFWRALSLALERLSRAEAAGVSR